MKVILFCANPYAFGILKPLHNQLALGNHKIIWYVPKKHLGSFPFRDEVNFTSSIAELFHFKSHAIFAPGNELPHYLRGVKVQIFHGMAGEKKGHFKIRHYFDLYLTQGPYFTQKFNELANKHKDFQVKETGWCKLDPLYQNHELLTIEKNQILKNHSKKHLVLYAPTFSPSLTSANSLKDEIQKLGKDKNIHLLVKFHDLMHREVVNQYQKLAKTHKNIEIISDKNILKYLVMADVMISDTSSVVYEFLLLNKPAITLNSISQNIVWLDISKPDQLQSALHDSIVNDSFAEQRQELISQYHPYNDGMSSQRMIAAVENYIAKHGVPNRRKLNLYRRCKMVKDFGVEPM